MTSAVCFRLNERITSVDTPLGGDSESVAGHLADEEEERVRKTFHTR